MFQKHNQALAKYTDCNETTRRQTQVLLAYHKNNQYQRDKLTVTKLYFAQPQLIGF